MSRLIETIKVHDNKVYNLFYHQQRIRESCLEIFGQEKSPINFIEIRKAIENLKPDLYKLRIVYDAVSFEFNFHPYVVKTIRNLKLVHINNYEYAFKYENRDVLNSLYNKRQDCDDILILKNGYVTDTFYTNVAFQKEGLWITPESPLLSGTKRQMLLDTEKLFTKQITKDEIHSFSTCRLFNAMIDFGEIEIPVRHIY